MLDLLFRDALALDGTGGPAFRAQVGVSALERTRDLPGGGARMERGPGHILRKFDR